jgi:hypothetical protein
MRGRPRKSWLTNVQFPIGNFGLSM